MNADTHNQHAKQTPHRQGVQGFGVTTARVAERWSLVDARCPRCHPEGLITLAPRGLLFPLAERMQFWQGTASAVP